ncbi:MAG: hypothetical protein ACI8T1_003105, partial [Verrucomicrobiales bacterium]
MRGVVRQAAEVVVRLLAQLLARPGPVGRAHDPDHRLQAVPLPA